MANAWSRSPDYAGEPKRASASVIARDVVLCSVLDAHTHTLEDDGVGVAGLPNGGRRRIERMLSAMVELVDEDGITRRVPQWRFVEVPGEYRFDPGAAGAAAAVELAYERDIRAPYSEAGQPALPDERWSTLRRAQIAARAERDREIVERLRQSQASTVAQAIGEMVEAVAGRVVAAGEAPPKPAKGGKESRA